MIPSAMESSSLVDEEDSRRSTFRRRNKLLILVLAVLIISLTLTIGDLISYLMRAGSNSQSDKPPSVKPVLEAFCFVSDAPNCVRTLNSIIRGTFISDPNQIFVLSLQLAAEHLQRTIAVLSNCSDSLQHGLGQVRDPLEAMQVDPFVKWKSDELRGGMMNRIVAAEADVEFCLDDLGRIGAPDGVKAELVEAKAYLNYAGDFVVGYAEALQMLAADGGVDSTASDRVFGVCMCGLQLVFVFCFCSFSIPKY